MTYSVPYSFVAGTKAKADEMNANFNDILDKIEVTNNRIDNTNTEIVNNTTNFENAMLQKADLDLSNLSEVGQGKFDEKANDTDIDGCWVVSHQSLAAAGKSITKNGTDIYSMSSYLPDDGERYEVLLSIKGATSTTSGNVTALGVKSDLFYSSMEAVKVVTRASSACYASSQATVIIGTSRSLYVFATGDCSGSPTYALDIFGYRKVR